MDLRILLYHHSTMCILSLPQFPQKATFVVLSQPYSHHIISSGPQSTLVAIETPVATTASWWASVFPHHRTICGLSLPQRPQKASLVVLILPRKPPQHPGCLQRTLVVTTTLCLSTDKPVSLLTPSLWSSAYSCSHQSQSRCPQQTTVVSSHNYGGPQLNHVVTTTPL